MASDLEQENADEIAALLTVDWRIGPCEIAPNPRDLLTDEELAEHQARLEAISRACIRTGFWR